MTVIVEADSRQDLLSRLYPDDIVRRIRERGRIQAEVSQEVNRSAIPGAEVLGIAYNHGSIDRRIKAQFHSPRNKGNKSWNTVDVAFGNDLTIPIVDQDKTALLLTRLEGEEKTTFPLVVVFQPEAFPLVPAVIETDPRYPFALALKIWEAQVCQIIGSNFVSDVKLVYPRGKQEDFRPQPDQPFSTYIPLHSSARINLINISGLLCVQVDYIYNENAADSVKPIYFKG